MRDVHFKASILYLNMAIIWITRIVGVCGNIDLCETRNVLDILTQELDEEGLETLLREQCDLCVRRSQCQVVFHGGLRQMCVGHCDPLHQCDDMPYQCM